jgi:hypothetical protein
MRMCNYLTFCLINFPLQTHHCRGKRLQQVVALSPGGGDLPRCLIERDGYALCHHAKKHVSKYQI